MSRYADAVSLSESACASAGSARTESAFHLAAAVFFSQTFRIAVITTCN